MRGSLNATIGVISDTHGRLHPRIPEVFEGVDLVVHAGDIGDPAILTELEAIAPVVAARGNTDHGTWAAELPVQTTFRAGALLGIVVHHMADAEVPATAAVVVSGHTHRPAVERRDGTLHLNPGSASESRVRGGGASVALLRVGPDGLSARIVRL